MSRPEPDLALYTFKKSSRGAPVYDSNFFAVMGAVGSQ